MRNYREAVKAMDGVNLCERFCEKPYPKTHFCNDFLRKGNDGQRIDHIVVSQSILAGGGLQVVAFETLQALGGFTGGSDHCPVWCRMEQPRHEVMVVKKRNTSEHPFLTLEVGGRKSCVS
jgi:hypothetical protein